LAGAKRRASAVGVIYVDIDRFKAVNDELGHAAGDDVLVAVAQRLSSVSRASDTVARVGGDEFVIVVEDDHDQCIDRLLRRIDEVMAEPIDVNGQPLPISISAGGASLDSAASGIDELLARADAAMYRTKTSRRS
jgi:diguanylate cyclase (GGDEF)-like protein